MLGTSHGTTPPMLITYDVLKKCTRGLTWHVRYLTWHINPTTLRLTWVVNLRQYLPISEPPILGYRSTYYI